MRRWLLALCLVLLPLSASGVVRTSSADFYWNGVATGSWTGGGTPAVTDQFNIVHHVVLQANPALTTGNLIIGSGGTLVVPAGITLQIGDGSAHGVATVGLRIDTGGTLIQEGALMRTCRITNPPNYAAGIAATHTVTVITDCDLTNVSTSTDFVFFGDEDPKDLDAVLTGGCVHAGPGLAPPGCHRPAFNKWASYDITAASGRTLTYDLDPQAGNYTASPNAPYVGSRYSPAATSITTAMMTYATTWLGRRTQVTITGYGTNISAIAEGDRGSWYLAFDDLPSLANDPTACSGLHAKILHAQDGGGANPDVLWVEGDLRNCTHASATAQITPGARRGDLIHVYRPATITGNTDGDVIGEAGIANAGGHWYARWARIDRPFGIQGAAWSPTAVRAGTVQFIQGSATAQPSADWDWVDIAYPGFTAGGDVGVLHFIAAGSLTDLRFPNNGVVNMAGSKFRHLHIHDSINNAVGGGGHGIYVDAAKYIDIGQARVERINDDCVGARFVRSDGSVVEGQSLSIRGLLNYECAAETANSQQGIEITVENEGEGLANLALSSSFTLQDALSIGHQTQPLGSFVYHTAVKGVTTGSVNDVATGSAHVFLRLDGTGAQATLDDPVLGAQRAFGNVVEDSNLYGYGNTTAVSPVIVSGWLRGSFAMANEQQADATHSYGVGALFDGSVVDLGAGTNASGYMVTGGALANQVRQAVIKDSVFRTTSASNTRFSQSLAPTAGPNFHLIQRAALLMGTPDTGGTNGFLAGFSGSTSLTNTQTTINGLFMTASAATTAATIVQGGAGNVVNINDVCAETTGTITTLYAGAGVSSRKIALPSNVPASTDAVQLRDLVAPEGRIGCRERNLPKRLGYQNFRVGHAMLGDFEIQQFRRSTSEPLIRVSGVGAGNAPPAGVAW